MNTHVITPGPYRATKLWNEVTRLFRAGMPLKKHRQNFRNHPSCFSASAAVEWLHQLLRNNSNFGPDVTRQQTVQLLKKFLKNHVIEDVKGRWGSEDLEDNNVLYRFPSTSPLKPIPCPAPSSSFIKKRPSLRDKDSFFKFRGLRKLEKETQENVDPAEEIQQTGEPHAQRRELTLDDEQEIWKDVTLTHLQRILGLASLDEVLNQRHINPQNIIHNMTKVNKHGVVSLDDKTNDIPHWVLSAMKSLANWPKYDSAQASYPGFERDVFKSVSDYFYSLPQPLLTFELYELFINVLVFCGYVAAPAALQLGKRKKSDLPSAPPPAKTSFRSTECLLLSLLRQGTCDEAESPMRDVLGVTLRSRMAALRAGEGQLGGSCMSLNTAAADLPPARSSSLETILSDSAPLGAPQQQLFLSSESLASSAFSSGRQHGDPSSAAATPQSRFAPRETPVRRESAQAVKRRSRLSVGSIGGLSVALRSRPQRPRSVGSCLDIVMETKEEEEKDGGWSGRAVSCFNVNAPSRQHHSTGRLPPPSSSLHPLSSSSFSSSSLASVAQEPHAAATADPGGPRAASSTSQLWMPPAATVVRRCLSTLDVSSRPVSLFKRPVCVPRPVQAKPQHSLLQPHCERVAIEALQLCTLLLPPASRRKLQLLMRMMSRISQNVDMPRLHPAIGTRTLMVHTFSGCVLGSAEECDLDELLATRLVSFLMDHQQKILDVPDYLLRAINDHIQYLRTAQVPIDTGLELSSEQLPAAVAPMPVFAFCSQISEAEFEQQKQASTQEAMETLLEILLTDQNLSEKDRRKKLKQFQKQYPDIYSRRFPASDRENKSESKPKIKPALLSIRKPKVFSIRN